MPGFRIIYIVVEAMVPGPEPAKGIDMTVLQAELLTRDGREARLTLITREGNALPVGALFAGSRADTISRLCVIATNMVREVPSLEGMELEVVDPYL